jgi:hypothetical protein
MNKVIIIGTIEFLNNKALIHKIEKKLVIINDTEKLELIDYAEKLGLDYVIPIEYTNPCYLHGCVDNEINDYLNAIARDRGTF